MTVVQTKQVRFNSLFIKETIRNHWTRILLVRIEGTNESGSFTSNCLCCWSRMIIGEGMLFVMITIPYIWRFLKKKKKKKKLFTNCTKYYSLPSVFTQDKDFWGSKFTYRLSSLWCIHNMLKAPFASLGAKQPSQGSLEDCGSSWNCLCIYFWKSPM